MKQHRLISGMTLFLLLSLFLGSHSTDAGFEEIQPGIIYDSITGLMWQKTDDGLLKSIYDAKDYCSNSTLGNYYDWRLPSPFTRELRASNSGLLDTSLGPPMIDPIFDCHSYHYWEDGPSGSWVYGVHFGEGYGWSDQLAGDFRCYARCVRGDILPPTAYFSGTPRSGNKPLTVSFNNESTGLRTVVQYDFGDGMISSSTWTHTYEEVGTYTVRLTITGPGGTDIETKTDYIIVAEPPEADFTAERTKGIKPLTVQFTDISTGTIDSYSWDFGDGGTSTLRNPSHTYTQSGDFAVSLTVIGPLESDVETKAMFVRVLKAFPLGILAPLLPEN